MKIDIKMYSISYLFLFYRFSFPIFHLPLFYPQRIYKHSDGRRHTSQYRSCIKYLIPAYGIFCAGIEHRQPLESRCDVEIRVTERFTGQLVYSLHGTPLILFSHMTTTTIHNYFQMTSSCWRFFHISSPFWASAKL